ncbi:hypothetical protein [Pseudoduganella namucuonensis]|uniref:Uncharacterized protein n=1 Tax=Pseudoduganella namucuonensis TaxID=1035707 RepID=A0A1I7KQ21_9BURK|nr:hypothetical protein [Pseudoduganella namucuonensis]SFU99537.1 hypothetical protein SAMN05216552_1018123 [Pseudoduganella namucuonensis]
MIDLSKSAPQPAKMTKEEREAVEAMAAVLSHPQLAAICFLGLVAYVAADKLTRMPRVPTIAAAV